MGYRACCMCSCGVATEGGLRVLLLHKALVLPAQEAHQQGTLLGAPTCRTWGKAWQRI
eukprot:CAMPEP_0202388328 /NCGR_PEP_ID=MMETSP1127-20130417/76928_1 /ASSEMBLY_ACC=CAM_ASM_000462 /TAXON_ID=3047 /ORGANISM="Dunaliella tertiolecta, Strain CCMP1320" /LENGTH=57 /DNA_ID=CAMNT_0048989705 /DNA_START=108 /DNA_END=278 /DNA_ORIENTATION=-